MIVTDYTTEGLKKLPLRAIVALAARCARRVEYLALLPDGHPDLERLRAAIDGALRLAEDFARGLPCRPADAVIREVQVCQASAQGDYVRETAVAAVVRAAHAAASALEAVGMRDEPARSSVAGTREPNPFPHLADVAADVAARDAFTAAVDAAGAVRPHRRVREWDRPGLSSAREARARRLSRRRPADRPLARGTARCRC